MSILKNKVRVHILRANFEESMLQRKTGVAAFTFEVHGSIFISANEESPHIVLPDELIKIIGTVLLGGQSSLNKPTELELILSATNNTEQK